MWIWILVHKVRCANGGTVFYYSTRWQDEKKKKKKSSFPNSLPSLIGVESYAVFGVKE